MLENAPASQVPLGVFQQVPRDGSNLARTDADIADRIETTLRDDHATISDDDVVELGERDQSAKGE